MRRGAVAGAERDWYYVVLYERCRYLEARIEKGAGWYTEHDEIECRALEWALDQLLEAGWPEETYDPVRGHLQGDDCS